MLLNESTVQRLQWKGNAKICQTPKALKTPKAETGTKKMKKAKTPTAPKAPKAKKAKRHQGNEERRNDYDEGADIRTNVI
jgi:hypothetical protein